MAKTKQEAAPDTVSAAYEFMAPKWAMMETLLAGTSAMRAAGETYLPRHAEEDQMNYNERLTTATLFNMFELTLDSLVGKPFSDPVRLNEDVPEKIASLERDIDLQGTNLTTFCRDWFREGLAKSFAHVLVDFPTLDQEERANRTREDDQRDNMRPYWSLIKPENVIFAHSEVVSGVEKLTHVRIFEEVVERQGFGEVFRKRIRVLEPGAFELWELLEPQDKRRKEEWVLVDQGTTDLDFIPLVTFYSNRRDVMLGKPPLEDLAYLNVRHWQSTSDQMNILTVARFPMLAASGVSDSTGASIAIGPRQLLGTKDPQGRFYYVEHEGAAIAAGRTDLMDLEELMSSYGAQFMRRRPGGPTATARALDTAEATSALQDHAIRFSNAIEVALDYTAAWLGEEEGGTVQVRTEFGPDKATHDRLQTLISARYGENGQPGVLSTEDFLAELQDLQILRDDFSAIENIARVKMELEAAGIDSTMIDPNDFQKDKPDATDEQGDQPDDD